MLRETRYTARVACESFLGARLRGLITEIDFYGR